MRRSLAPVALIALLFTCAQCALAPFPLEAILNATLERLPHKDVVDTGLTKETYLETMISVVHFFARYQDGTGRIIDPYAKEEIQYATPTFSLAATMVAKLTNNESLLELAAKAVDSSLKELATGTCAQGHSNFYTMPLMFTYDLLKSVVDRQRLTTWDEYLHAIPLNDYHTTGNWGIVAAAGEYLRHLNGFTNLNFTNYEMGLQLPLFSDFGMYPDPNTPMPYDLFPRHYMDTMLYYNYTSVHTPLMKELLTRGAWTSAAMQSPWGEIPVGGRSGQHTWNEGAQCVVFELYASRMKAAGNMVAARAFKRAARLSHKSIRRWYQPEGDLYILKNHFPPAERFGYEEYSFLSQYNLLPMSMLVYSYFFADDTITEGPSFAETGGYVFQIATHHKIFANVGGLFVEIETAADPEYDSTGFTRFHHPTIDPLIGPSAACPSSVAPSSIGIGWVKDGVRETLSKYNRGFVNTTLHTRSMSADLVVFDVVYVLKGAKVAEVIEHYEVTASSVNITAAVSEPVDSLFVIYPVFMYDGKTNTTCTVKSNSVSAVFGTSRNTFTVVQATTFHSFNASGLHKSRNGYIALYEAHVGATQKVSYSLVPSKA